MQSTFLRVTARTALAIALATLALPAAAQSPSTPASPTGVTSPAPIASPGAAPSGYTWTLLAPPAGDERAFLSASGVAADGTWAALAYDLDAKKRDGRVWLLGPSATGVELVRIPKSAGAEPRSLTRLGDQLLAVGAGTTWSSPDGSVWTPAKNKLKRLSLSSGSASDGTRAVFIGNVSGKDDLAVLSTTDGKAFAQATIKAPQGKLMVAGVALSPTGIVVVSASDLDEISYLWSSPDGVTFTPATLPFEAQDGNAVRGLAAAPSGLVMVASLDSGPVVVYTSPDGQTWTETFASRTTTNGDSIVTLPASSGGGLLMIGNGFLYTSPDGVTWTETPTPELEGILGASTAAALPDGRIVLAVSVVDDTAEYGASRAVLVGTPQP